MFNQRKSNEFKPKLKWSFFENKNTFKIFKTKKKKNFEKKLNSLRFITLPLPNPNRNQPENENAGPLNAFTADESINSLSGSLSNSIAEPKNPCVPMRQDSHVVSVATFQPWLSGNASAFSKSFNPNKTSFVR